MMVWELALLIISIGCVILMAFLVPTVWQLRRTAKRVEIAAETLNHHLPTILTNVEEISSNLTTILISGKRQVSVLEEATDEIRGLVNDIVQFEREVRRRVENPLIETMTTVTAVARAVRAFMQVMRSQDEK